MSLFPPEDLTKTKSALWPSRSGGLPKLCDIEQSKEDEEAKESDSFGSLPDLVDASLSVLPSSVGTEEDSDTKETEESFGMRQLWSVRHGERMDATHEFRAFIRATPHCRRFDPPLTKTGKLQAHKRGVQMAAELAALKKKFPAMELPTRIYASPLDRALNTAVEIAAPCALPVTVVPGLATCAAALEWCGVRLDASGGLVMNLEEHLPFLTKAQMRETYATHSGAIDFDYEHLSEHFEQCVRRLFAEEVSDLVVCVSHREGLRSLIDCNIQHFGSAFYRVPYCARFKYTLEPIPVTKKRMARISVFPPSMTEMEGLLPATDYFHYVEGRYDD